jgi:hypothetical protein
MPNSGGTAAARSKQPLRFFEQQLANEESLAFETARRLYQLSAAVLDLKPWELLDDHELVLFEDPASKEICYCSILGSLGTLSSVHVYVGAESYRMFRRILEEDSITGGELYSALKGVSVEFALPGDLTSPDRKLLEAFGYVKRRGGRAPIFRAFRPGYHPWYVTEAEGKLLAHGLEYVLALCREEDESDGIADYWEEEGTFPFLSPDPENSDDLVVRLVSAPEPPAVRPQPVHVEEEQVHDILRRQFSRTGAVEVSHFFTLAQIGHKDERKSCTRGVVVCDADSGFAYHVEAGQAGDSTGELFVRALLASMKNARFVPREIRVKDADFKIVLGELAAKLDLKLTLKDSLPFADEFERGLREHLGDPGVIPY